MTKCKVLNEQVTVGSYQYITTDKISKSTYAYKRQDPAKQGSYLEFPHFTVVDTGNGENEFRKFHYKFEFNRITFQLNYFYNIDQNQLEFKGLAKPIYQEQQTVYDADIKPKLETDYHPLALEFCNGVQRR